MAIYFRPDALLARSSRHQVDRALGVRARCDAKTTSRRRRDSNPWTACTVGGFQNRCHRPLGHSSGVPGHVARPASLLLRRKARVEPFERRGLLAVGPSRASERGRTRGGDRALSHPRSGGRLSGSRSEAPSFCSFKDSPAELSLGCPPKKGRRRTEKTRRGVKFAHHFSVRRCPGAA